MCNGGDNHMVCDIHFYNVFADLKDCFFKSVISLQSSWCFTCVVFLLYSPCLFHFLYSWSLLCTHAWLGRLLNSCCEVQHYLNTSYDKFLFWWQKDGFLVGTPTIAVMSWCPPANTHECHITLFYNSWFLKQASPSIWDTVTSLLQKTTAILSGLIYRSIWLSWLVQKTITIC